MKKKLKNFGIEVKSIIELLLKSSKKNTFFLIFTNIISGLMIPVEILIWKYFIDSVVVSISSKKIFMPVLILIIRKYVIIRICQQLYFSDTLFS